AIRDGRAVSAEILNQRKDGTRFWNHVFITPVTDEAGRPLFFLSTQVDISRVRQAVEMQAELRASQKELDETNERLRQTLTVAGTGGAWEWDIPSRRFVADTRFADLHGLDPAEAAAGLPAEAFFRAIHPD